MSERERRRWPVPALAVALIAAAALIGTGEQWPTGGAGPSTVNGVPAPTGGPGGAQWLPVGTLSAGEARRALEVLPRRPDRERDDYEREDFGPAWAEVDLTGCGQRDEVLARDLRTRYGLAPTVAKADALASGLADC